jgi:hypothetical protein
LRLEDVCHEIVGLVPVYDQNGDCCQIYRQEEESLRLTTFTEMRTVEMAKRQLARCHALDLAAQAISLRQDYHRAPPLPFYFHDERVFVPLKMRQPKISGDATYGYLEMSIITKVVPDTSGRCNVILSDGSSLPVYTQINTARLAVYFGLEIQRDIFSNHRSKQRQALQALNTLHNYLTS